jgi:hypothetical protein
VNAKVAVTLIVPGFPSRVPVARFCDVVESVSAPEAQVAFGVEAPLAVALAHVTLTALTGTDVQPVSVDEAARTPSVQARPALLAMVHVMVAELLPAVGVVSGLLEVKVIVVGETVNPVIVVVAACDAGLPNPMRMRTDIDLFAITGSSS